MKRHSALVFTIFLSTVLFWSGEAPAADPVLEWEDLVDGGGKQDDIATAALADTAGNLIIAGTSVDGDAGADILVRKLARATGDTIWTRRVPAVDGNDMDVGGMAWDGYGDLLIGGTRLGCYG